MAYCINPYEVGGDAGKQRFAGEILTLLESTLTHPSHTDGLADAGDPVYVNGLHGVALESASAATDYIAVSTKGVWDLAVVPQNGDGNSNVAVGDTIYIATDTGILSKINTGVVFGFALGAATGGSSATVIPVCLLPQVTTVTAVGNVVGQYFTTSYQFAAADVAKQIFVAPAACSVVSASLRYGTAAGQAGTLTLEKCGDGEAAGAGDVCLAAAFDLASTPNTDIIKAATADGKEDLVQGDALRLKLASGAATSLADAIITVTLAWA